MISKSLEEYFIDAGNANMKNLFIYLYYSIVDAGKNEFSLRELCEAIGLNDTRRSY